ncbi:ATP-binding protein [Bacillus salitolerans]|uniref:ATP-binding protein n=1 Tax=Bacillus salitolerans TaxID=1437434 RepID=UPI003A8EEEFD
METTLRESENKFRQLFDNARNGLCIVDNHGCIVNMNSEAHRMFSCNQYKSKNMKIQNFISKSGEKERDSWQSMLANEDKTGQFEVLGNDLKMRMIDYSISKNIYSGHHLIILLDVTEKREMEERLRKSDTLNVVGELAAGIAHEIRNPMTALKGFIQLLQGSIQDEHTLYFEVITSELKRIESIITEFLILAKPQAVRYERSDIYKIVQETIDLLRPQATLDNIQFKLQANASRHELYCEKNQLKQVFINILKNGIEVMPNGGVIFVTIDQPSQEEMRVSILDQGPGMTEEKLKRLGEPFYTTKERGTGLGLMVSYKIIGEHRGRIEVESVVNVGTTFHIYLPFDGAKFCRSSNI